MRLKKGDTRIYRLNDNVYIAVVEAVDERTNYVTMRIVSGGRSAGLTLHREYHHIHYYTVEGWVNV